MTRTTLEVIAPSIEEAISRGMDQLGVSRDLLEIVVLDEGSKGFLGIGSRQVRLRLTVKEVEPYVEEKAPIQQDAEPGAVLSSDDDLLNFAQKATADLLSLMKIKSSVSVQYGEAEEEGASPLLVDIHGDDLGVLIGRRTETLNALQYILALIISKHATRWVQVVVDVEGYRTRRERQLRQLARRMAEQTIRTGKRQVLEPMPAAERRIIHLELRENNKVSTESIGEEPNRKISIVLKK